jgi:hypothetical protein
MKQERQEHDGHRIELRERGRKTELLIDDVPVRYGRLPNGKYFLHEYAYDWSDDVVDLARKFIDYRRRVESIRADGTPAKKGE